MSKETEEEVLPLLAAKLRFYKANRKMHIIYQQWAEQSYPVMIAVFLISEDAAKFLQAYNDPTLKYVYVICMDEWDAIRNRMHDQLDKERVDTDDESL